jgi:hypothetical protein
MQLQANRLIWILKRFRLKTARTKQQ